ncbi:MAG: hypothetical protein ACRDUA_17420 [Micromonosporaceae bacterium]
MRRALLCLLAVAAISAGCTSTPPTKPEPALRVAWREATLPVPPGPEGRLAVRDAVKCASHWYVVGGVFTGPGESRPAAWRSTDGRTWTHLRFAPRWYWAHRNVIASAACHDGRIVMEGAKSGGAHGNPRVSTWYARDDGVYIDVLAAFSLYGGTQAVNVGPIAAGATGWMIAGNRSSGAAVWSSGDGTDFRLLDTDPGLSSDSRTSTAALGLTYADGRWTVVGGATLDGRVARTPLAWVSTDGETWRRQSVPHGDDFAELQRVIGYRGGVLAAGIDGDTFRIWRRDGDRWRRTGRFGTLDPDGTASPAVSGLTRAGAGVVATVSDSSRYTVWAAPDTALNGDHDSPGAGWRRVATPTRPSTAGEHIMTAVGSGDDLMLLADDAKRGRVWLAAKINFR